MTIKTIKSLNTAQCIELSITRPMIDKSEASEQAAYFDWLRYHIETFPLLKLMFHPVNEGKRSQAMGRKLQTMGMLKGVPDVVCLGLNFAIEFKVYPNAPTPYQAWWLQELSKAGVYVGLAYSFEEARKFTECVLTGDSLYTSAAYNRAQLWQELHPDYKLDPWIDHFNQNNARAW